ncbi:MAG: hypothetical protein EZS28_016405 [Streblomastix strix]|uniref:Uncharacterized protein n=1 Tax=Streblomastix strix TaxID=222440 RepID=A0A5J4VZH8_9EUKA|nr:MAG: hypothetical protein EZS28_016405 [Streblomastix strix]
MKNSDAVFRANINLMKDKDDQTIQNPINCRYCLNRIQSYGDEQVQVDLVTMGYSKVLGFALSTSGGNEQEQDEEIRDGLFKIYTLLISFHYGGDTLPSQPALSRICEEQIEEEGANEEIDSQYNSKGIDGDIKDNAKKAKGNLFFP